MVKPGDTITKDQPVLELETDKATIEVPSSVAGQVKEIKVKAGDKVKVGQAILSVDEGAGESASKPAEKAAAKAEKAEATPEKAKAKAETAEQPQRKDTKGAAKREEPEEEEQDEDAGDEEPDD